eukprot:TRINITY_DN54967_c0_g1_i1.p1 TRINITY_DN54967_c0_g1~~TRINITY_DN54967_c0_g1_i1.p1  ORF type:complete len:714 (+),score=79.81 TRINITY_DN54967_c0_g1_i1:37-2178(+)
MGDQGEGPLSPQQVQGLVQLQELMKTRDMSNFAELLRYHGTFTDIRMLVQADQSALAPILYQMNRHTPKLVAAINKYQTQFLAILNEPVPQRPSTTDTEEWEFADEALFLYPHLMYQQALSAAPGPPVSEQPGDAAVAAAPPPPAQQTAVQSSAPPPEPARAQEEEKREATEIPSETQNQMNDESQAESKHETEQVEQESSAVAFNKLQQALVAQGKFEEALVVAEQSRVDVNGGALEDALFKQMMSSPLTRSQAKAAKGASSSQTTSSTEYHLSIQDIRTIVREAKTTVVMYSLITSVEKLYIWVVPKEEEAKITFNQVPIDIEQMQANLVALGRSLKKNTGLNPRAVWRRSLRKLYSELIAPIEDALPSDSNECVTFIPADQTMMGLPFHALMKDDSAFLIHNHTMAVVQSIHMLGLSTQSVLSKRNGTASGTSSSSTTTSENIMYQTLQAADMKDFLTTPKTVASNLTIVAALPDISKLSNPVNDALTCARSLMAGGGGATLTPLWRLSNKSTDHETILNFFYNEMLKIGQTDKPKGTPMTNIATAHRAAMLQGISNIPDVDIWTWAYWSLVGSNGAMLTSSSVGGGQHSSSGRAGKDRSGRKHRSGQSPSQRRLERQQKQADNYQYLKGKCIHVLYERIVGELLKERPEHPTQFILQYMTEHKTDLNGLLNESKKRAGAKSSSTSNNGTASGSQQGASNPTLLAARKET